MTTRLALLVWLTVGAGGAFGVCGCSGEDVELVTRNYAEARDLASVWLNGPDRRTVVEGKVRVWGNGAARRGRAAQRDLQFAPRASDWPAVGGLSFDAGQSMVGEELSVELLEGYTLILALRLDESPTGIERGTVFRFGGRANPLALEVTNGELFMTVDEQTSSLAVPLAEGEPLLIVLRVSATGGADMRVNGQEAEAPDSLPAGPSARALDQLGGGMDWTAGLLALFPSVLADEEVDDLETELSHQFRCCGGPSQ